ncbi:17490_t:CDS:2, partial [Racocetra persica]
VKRSQKEPHERMRKKSTQRPQITENQEKPERTTQKNKKDRLQE